jgi:hypothetical protein
LSKLGIPTHQQRLDSRFRASHHLRYLRVAQSLKPVEDDREALSLRQCFDLPADRAGALLFQQRLFRGGG